MLFVKVMREEWAKYLLNKVQLRDIVHKKKKPKDPKGFGILDGVTPIAPAQKMETSTINKQEHDALLAAASELKKRVENVHVVEDTLQPDFSGQVRSKGKRKLGNRNSPIIVDGSGAQTDNKDASTSEKTGMSVDNMVLRRHTNPDSASGSGKPLPPVHFYALESDQPVLDILKPSIIIVYHPDMAFVREIEVYKAENPSKRLKVYFIFYEDSTEVQKFEASIRRENGAFEYLIRQKSMMMIPVDQVCFTFFSSPLVFPSFWLLVGSFVLDVVAFSKAKRECGTASYQIIDF